MTYYGFDPADYGYIWYNEIRGGPLDDFFAFANEAINGAKNTSRLYSVSDPSTLELVPDDFVGTWTTISGIVFTISSYDGDYLIEFSENDSLGLLGGWFSENIYNIEGKLGGMAGYNGNTSFSVFYEYGSEYPVNTWLTLNLTTADGTEIRDVVPLISN